MRAFETADEQKFFDLLEAEDQEVSDADQHLYAVLLMQENGREV